MGENPIQTRASHCDEKASHYLLELELPYPVNGSSYSLLHSAHFNNSSPFIRLQVYKPKIDHDSARINCRCQTLHPVVARLWILQYTIAVIAPSREKAPFFLENPALLQKIRFNRFTRERNYDEVREKEKKRFKTGDNFINLISRDEIFIARIKYIRAHTCARVRSRTYNT